MSTALHRKIDQLLHDAEHAESGAQFAAMMMRSDPHNPTHRRIGVDRLAERDRLVSEALKLDPSRSAPAWQETTLDLN